MSAPSADAQCPHCRRVFRTRRGLQSHLNRSHDCAPLDRARQERRRAAAFHALQRVCDEARRAPPAAAAQAQAGPPPKVSEEPLRLEALAPEQPRSARTTSIDGDRPAKRPRTDEPPPRAAFVEQYPSSQPTTHGRQPSRWEQMRDARLAGRQGRWAAFETQDEWELARWLVKSGVSQSDLDKFLKLSIIRDRTRLSFQTREQFLELVDALPTSDIPAFKCELIPVKGTLLDPEGRPRTQVLELWKRDPVECVRDILSNPALASAMSYTPVREFTARHSNERIYHEAHTAEWWWDTQAKLPPGATIAPVILMSDKTQLSRFGGDKQAYPVYLTIGNVAKGVRPLGNKRATVLLGYLPVANLDCLPEKERQPVMDRLFHFAMSKMLAPLAAAGRDGLKMTCADGYIRHVHPILFAYVSATHLDQCTAACCLQDRCPQCRVDPQHRGARPGSLGACTAPRRPQDVKVALRRHRKGDTTPLFATDGLLPIYAPFWAELPHCNIFSCIMPDLLCQIHSGVYDERAGENQTDVQETSRWAGPEATQLESIFAGLQAGAPDDPKVTTAARAFVDFLYYSSYTSHTSQTLRDMQASLDKFHAHKAALATHGIRAHFNAPEFHAPQHYASAVVSHGALDGYTTALPARLHVDLAHAGHRAAGGSGAGGDYFAQVAAWLRRQEAMEAFALYLEWVMPDYQAVALDDSASSDDDGQADISGDDGY